MVNTKQSVLDLVQVCFRKKIRKVVFSPGSRNAPLIIAFAEHGGFETFSIADERVAAFFALGMAQQSGETVAIVSTSGSAALNYAPALAEAYYQRISLLALTADRPPEWIDQGNGQTMRQRGLYQNFIKKSYEISHETTHPDELWYNIRIYNEAINESSIEPRGPVHINIPLREPLYDIKVEADEKRPIKIIEQISPPPELSADVLDSLAEEWNKSDKKMILCGITPKSDELNEILTQLANDPSVVVLTETTSNLTDPNFIEQLDRVLFTLDIDKDKAFCPDLLLTFGTNIISKKIKTLFRKWKIRKHWHLDETDIVIDTFQSLSKHLRSDLLHFLDALNKRQVVKASDYRSMWFKLNKHCKRKHEAYIEKIAWSDMQAYYHCLKMLPKDSQLQMANSTAVRYVQLMEKRKDIKYYSNRGVAGIDGCSSTAMGAAWATDDLTVLVTGDIAFFYDSNAFWIPYHKSNTRIILFNNEGGSIFRFIPGPDQTNQLETFFEAHHKTKAKHIAKAFNLKYLMADDESSLKEILPDFFSLDKNDRPVLLEIFTPRKQNDKILKSYFQSLA